MTDNSYKDKYIKTKDLLQRAYQHLKYCGYGDTWERECSVELRRDLDTFFNQEKTEETK